VDEQAPLTLLLKIKASSNLGHIEIFRLAIQKKNSRTLWCAAVLCSHQADWLL